MTVEVPVQICPTCDTPVTSTPGYPAWCTACEWGLDEAAEPSRKGFLRARLDARSARLVEDLYAELTRTEVRRPGWDLARFCSYAIAVGVHFFTVGLLVLAVLAALFWHIVGIILAFVLVVIAFFIRPRFGRLSKASNIRFRADAPALFALVDRLGEEVGAKPVHAVVVSREFNASYGTVGLRRRPVLTLGLPLWEALSGQQRVALLGHELAHGVNGDARHGLVVGTSLAGLGRLYRALRPGGRDHRVNYLIDLVARSVQAVLAWIVGWVFRAQWALTLRAGQRAEYLADELAAKAGSSAAAVAMLDTLLTSAETHYFVIRRHALNAKAVDFWDEWREALERLPELEKERRRRVAARERLRVDESHPPTHLRMALLSGRPSIPAQVTLDPVDEEKIRAELAPEYDRVARELRDEMRASMYRG